mgnify:CR=1 FL=1
MQSHGKRTRGTIMRQALCPPLPAWLDSRSGGTWPDLTWLGLARHSLLSRAFPVLLRSARQPDDHGLDRRSRMRPGQQPHASGWCPVCLCRCSSRRALPSHSGIQSPTPAAALVLWLLCPRLLPTFRHPVRVAPFDSQHTPTPAAVHPRPMRPQAQAHGAGTHPNPHPHLHRAGAHSLVLPCNTFTPKS